MKRKQILSLALALALCLTSTAGLMTFAEDPPAPAVFTDDMDDYSKLADYSLPSYGYLQIETWEGDTVVHLSQNGFRLLKNADGVMVERPYFTWAVNPGAAKIQYTTKCASGWAFTPSWSADGETFTDFATGDIAVSDPTVDEIGAFTAGTKLFTITSIDPAARYFRLTWPVITNNNHWEAAIGKLIVTGGTAAAAPAFNKTITMARGADAAETQALMTKDAAAYTENAFDFNTDKNDNVTNGVPVLRPLYAYLDKGKSDDKTVANPYVVYEVPTGSPFRATFLIHESYPRIGRQPKLYVSDAADGTFTAVAVAIERSGPMTKPDGGQDGNYSYLTLTLGAVPAGKRFVKVELPYDRDFRGLAYRNDVSDWSNNRAATEVLTYLCSLQQVQYRVTEFRDDMNYAKAMAPRQDYQFVDFNLPNVNMFEADPSRKDGSGAADAAIQLNAGGLQQCKNADGEMVLRPYITWPVKAGAASIDYMTYCNGGLAFTPSWSADGATFHAFAAGKIAESTPTAADVGVVAGNAKLFTIREVDPSARYFRLTWPEISSDQHWDAAVSMVRVRGGEAAAAPAFDKVVTMQNDLAKDTAGMVDYANAFQFDQKPAGLPALMVNYNYVKGKDSVAKPYVVYKAAAGKALRATFIVNEDYFRLDAPIVLSAADRADGTYTPVPAGIERSGCITKPDGGEVISDTLLTLTITVPAGKNFVKVEFPNDKDFTGAAWKDGIRKGTSPTCGAVLNFLANLHKVEYTAFTEETPTPGDKGEVTFVDDLNDLNTMGVKVSDPMKFLDYNLPSLGLFQGDKRQIELEDTTKVVYDQAIQLTQDGWKKGTCNADGEMVLLPYLTWKMNKGPQTIDFLAYQDGTEDFTLAWSADGQNFTAFPAANVTKVRVGAENYADFGLSYAPAHPLFAFTIRQIDASAQYFRATWPQIPKTGQQWHAAVSQFKVYGGTAETEPAYANTVTMQNDKAKDTADMVTYHKDGFVFDQKPDNKPVLMVNYSYLKGKTAVEKPYVVYKAKDSTAFQVTFQVHEDFYRLNCWPKLYVSSKPAAGWEEIAGALSRKASATSNNYSYLTITIPAIPAGKNYVKIEYPHDKDFTGTPYNGGLVDYNGKTGVNDPMTVLVNIQQVQFSKAAVTEEEQKMVSIPFTGVKPNDVAKWVDYTDAMFVFTERLSKDDTTIPFLSLNGEKVAGKTSLDKAYVVYRTAFGTPFELRSVNHDKTKRLGLAFKLYSSKDMQTWTAITDVAYESQRSDFAGWNDDVYKVEHIPADHEYIKVEWPNEKDYADTIDPGTGAPFGETLNYSPGLTGVSLIPSDAGNIKPDDDPRLIETDNELAFSNDEQADTKAMHSYSQDTFDFTQSLQFGDRNVSVLSLLEDFVSGQTDLPEAAVVYQVDAGSPFKIEGYVNAIAGRLGLKFRLFVSPDGETWSEADDLLYVSETMEADADWQKETYGIKAVPDGTKYVKIVWPNTKDYTDALDPETGKTIDDSLSYVPALAKVFYNGPVDGGGQGGDDPGDDDDPGEDDHTGGDPGDGDSTQTGDHFALAAVALLGVSAGAVLLSRGRRKRH